MMSTTTLLILLLLVNTAVGGFFVGLHHAALRRKMDDILEAIRTTDKQERRRNTGVVKPGLNAEPYREADSSEPRKSSVVRPRPPATPQDDTNAALNAARTRVGQ